MLKPTKFDYKSIFFSDTSSDTSDDLQSSLASVDDLSNDLSNDFPMKSSTFNIDIEMSKAYKKNESKILSESIRPIANGIYANYNSLNIIVGAQGKGKSHIVLRDIIQISRLKDAFHLIVYISKNGVINDSTFDAQRELIKLPVKVISDSNAENYLKELDLWKELYEKYMNNNISLSTEKVNNMLSFLGISQRDTTKKSLNTVILCEDFIKSKLLKSSYFTNYITQLRHKHSIVYINVQFFKAIPTDYKNNCTSFFIFNGFSRQKMHYIYQQVVMPIEFEDLWKRYYVMKNHDFVLVNTRENSIDFISCM